MLLAMERAGADDIEEGVEIERIGIGTPATRADIIEKLKKEGYIQFVMRFPEKAKEKTSYNRF